MACWASPAVADFAVTGLSPPRLNIPIFQGGKVRADVQQADAVLKQRQAQVDNLKAGIEQDVQDALLDLKAAAQAGRGCETGLDLAQQTVAQSQDRFAAGVTNNVEVIQAQQQLASANDQYIASLYAHNIAKVLLARAIGNAEQAKQYSGRARRHYARPQLPPNVNSESGSEALCKTFCPARGRPVRFNRSTK